jgi:hypothetical protein
LAILVLLSPHLQQDRLYSKDVLSWRLVTTTAGYFVYDLYVHTVRYQFMASLVHAAAALVVFITGIRFGILHYYGACATALGKSSKLHHSACLCADPSSVA